MVPGGQTGWQGSQYLRNHPVCWTESCLLTGKVWPKAGTAVDRMMVARATPVRPDLYARVNIRILQGFGRISKVGGISVMGKSHLPCLYHRPVGPG